MASISLCRRLFKWEKWIKKPSMKTIKLTKSQSALLKLQYKDGADLSKQKAVVKIFNPYGRGRWYLLNQDPADEDYVWAIVQMGDSIKMGSVSLNSLIRARVKPFNLPLEKDLSFEPTSAKAVWQGLHEGNYFAKGGQVQVDIAKDDVKMQRYAGVLGDFDKDGIPNSDDPHPTRKGDKKAVEEKHLTGAIETLFEQRPALKEQMRGTAKGLAALNIPHSKVIARVKSPYSIINKLVEKKMLVPGNPKKGLTDIIGTTLIVDSTQDLREAEKKIRAGALGKVIEAEDFYAVEHDGYKAVHFIIEGKGGIPVEVQVKTHRQKAINELSHTPYKYNNLNAQRMGELSELARKADDGDNVAARKLDGLLKDPEKVKLSLWKDKTKIPKFGKGGELPFVEQFSLDNGGETLTDNLIDAS